MGCGQRRDRLGETLRVETLTGALGGTGGGFDWAYLPLTQSKERPAHPRSAEHTRASPKQIYQSPVTWPQRVWLPNRVIASPRSARIQFYP